MFKLFITIFVLLPVFSVLMKTLPPPLGKSGVYRLHCSSCPAVYIGETSRALIIRVREHFDEIDSDNRILPAFAEHIQTTEQACDPYNTIFLHFEDFRQKRLALEELEILRHGHNKNYIVLSRVVPDDNSFLFLQLVTVFITDSSVSCYFWSFSALCLFTYLLFTSVLYLRRSRMVVDNLEGG